MPDVLQQPWRARACDLRLKTSVDREPQAQEHEFRRAWVRRASRVGQRDAGLSGRRHGRGVRRAQAWRRGCPTRFRRDSRELSGASEPHQQEVAGDRAERQKRPLGMPPFGDIPRDSSACCLETILEAHESDVSVVARGQVGSEVEQAVAPLERAGRVAEQRVCADRLNPRGR